MYIKKFVSLCQKPEAWSTFCKFGLKGHILTKEVNYLFQMGKACCTFVKNRSGYGICICQHLSNLIYLFILERQHFRHLTLTCPEISNVWVNTSKYGIFMKYFRDHLLFYNHIRLKNIYA